MSFKALDRIEEVDPPTSAATLLLFILASYAGPDGTCFPSQGLLCKRAKLGERAVRDNLKALVDAGLVEVTPCFRRDGTRTSNGYRLLYYTPEQPFADAGQRVSKRTRPPADIAGGSTHAKALPDKGLDAVEGVSDHRQISPVDHRRLTPPPPAINAGLTTFEPVSEPVGCAYTHPEACERGRAEFDRVVVLWSATAPERCSRVKAWPKWQEAVAAGQSPADLERAAGRYLTEAGEVKRKLCKALDRWLSEAWFENWLPGQTPPDAKPSAPTWSGDPAVRAWFVAAIGEAATASYVDPARWDADRRALIPATRYAADKLAAALRGRAAPNFTLAERSPS